MFHPTVLLISGLLSCISAASLQPQVKIVGGAASDIASIPYQVSLQISGRHFCGGSIYSSRIIVTAAHCVRALTTPTQIKIRYGSSQWASGGTLIGVIKALVHANYSSSTMQNDVAILKTDRAIVLSASVKSVKLAELEVAGGTQGIISGWGTLSSGATSIPSQLQSANVKIISRSTCQSKAYGYGRRIGSTMLCAGGSGTDSCQGDSGGPLVVAGVQVGIVSWGSGCAKSFYPGVYSSVAVLKNFVIDNAKLL